VTIRVVLPAHLRQLARCPREITLDAQPTQRSVIDAIEELYPVLRGTIRDVSSGKRRPFVRFFACGEDLSHDSPDDPLPDAVADGKEAFRVVGAMAGG
jgi:sulfur-carrier protein